MNKFNGELVENISKSRSAKQLMNFKAKRIISVKACFGRV